MKAIRSTLFILILVVLLSTVIHACGDDDDDDETLDDDDDNGGSGPGDDDDDDSFYCGKDMECHEDFIDCAVECETWQCIEDVCDPAYLACLDDDGCVEPFIVCKDVCGDDEDCLASCEGDFVDCLVNTCGAEGTCLDACFDVQHVCQSECGLNISCHILCLLDFWDCTEDCIP